MKQIATAKCSQVIPRLSEIGLSLLIAFHTQTNRTKLTETPQQALFRAVAYKSRYPRIKHRDCPTTWRPKFSQAGRPDTYFGFPRTQTYSVCLPNQFHLFLPSPSPMGLLDRLLRRICL